MSRLSPLKAGEVIRKLRCLGYIGPIPGGKHVRMVNQKTGQIIPIPVHGNRDISVGLIREIIRQVGVTRNEWIEL